MASSLSPVIVTNDLAFSIDMYNQKSFIGAPVTNYAYQRHVRSDLTYASYVATSSGTWQAKHPDAIRVYNSDSGSEITGNVNSGVTDWTNTYHGVYNYDTELKRPVFIMRNYDGNWKANSFGLSVGTFAAMGLTNGSTYTISWLQWVDNLGACANAGIYSQNTSSVYSFWDGLSSGQSTAYNTQLYTWQRVYATYTVNAVVNVNVSHAGVYMYGMDTASNCVIKIVDVQVEVGSVPSSYSRTQTRSNTQSIIDLTGNTTLTVNNLVYATNNTFSFNGSSSYITSNTTTLTLSGGTMEMWVRPSAVNRTQGWFNIVGGGSYINFYQPSSNNMRWEVIRTTGSSYSTILSSTALQANTWYHVVGTFNGINTTTLYINGVQEAQQTNMTNQPYTITAPIEVGRYSGNGQGTIGNANFYTRELTATEVQQNFNALRGRYGL